MLSQEKYEGNVIIDDKYNINAINVKKSVTYKGEIDLLAKGSHKYSDTQIPPLAAAVVGINNTSAPLPSDLDYVNIWTDIDAQEAFLNTNPTKYLILGKPGLGSYTLGENLAKKMNCIHLSSKSVISEEIEQKSPTGRCLDFNMRHNKVCKFETILAIMKRKIKSSVIEHRGYVISGLPLVTSNRKEQYLLTNLYKEESLSAIDELLYDIIWNLKRKKPKRSAQKASTHSSETSDLVKGGEEEEEQVEEEQQQEMEEAEEEQEPPVEMPKYLLDICSDIVIDSNISLTTKKAVLLQQSQELFNFKPDILIHIMSSDTDAITKKGRKYFNYKNNSNTFNSFIPNTDLNLRWPHKCTMIDYSKPYDSYLFNPKYNCKQPINFERNSLNQICNYKSNVSPFLDLKFKDFNSKYLLKVDGRTSVHQMLHYIMGKLLLMPIKPVLIPKPLYLEEPPEDLEEFWNTIKQLNTIKSGVLNFNRYASPWYMRCPVELKKRRSVRGKLKLAVSLFKNVFLLSSLDVMISFCKNPRPYLKLEYLEPTCRVIIMGSKSSGKTMIASCLSWLFDTPITCYKNFLSNERKKKYDTFSKSILSEIIATIEDGRFARWQIAEAERKTNLDNWFTTGQNNLKDYVSIFERNYKCLMKEMTKEVSKEEVRKTEASEEEGIEEAVPEEAVPEEVVPEDIPDEELREMIELSSKLLFLPILDDLEECKLALLDKNLIKFAPPELTTVTEKPKLPILGDDDVTEAIDGYIVANDLQKDIEPTAEELIIEMTQVIINKDQKSLEQHEKYGKFIIDGFPSDPEYWGYLEASKVLPDYTIVIIENKEIDDELIHKYSVIDKSHKKHDERFILSLDPLVKLKQLHKKPLETTHLEDVQIILHDVLDVVLDSIFIDEPAANNIGNVASFTEALDKFREEWDSVKIKLEDDSRAVIVVEIENKSDIDIIDEVLLQLRQNYYLPCTPSEGAEPNERDDKYVKDMLTYNDSSFLGETNIYCPIAFYDYGVMWEGKSEFCSEFENKIYNFCKEEFLEVFQKEVTKYQALNRPFKSLPPLRLCVAGSIGSGKTTLCKQIAKELGLLHVDFAEFINSYLLPRHFKKVGRQYENSFKDTPIDEEAVMEFQVDEENDRMAFDILGNENEIRRIIYNYFEKGVPLISALMQKLIKTLWNTEPFTKIGFVLDGFPKLPNDVEDMIACFCIPDLVIDLQGSSEKTLERLSSKMLKRWKVQLNEAKDEVRMKIEKERQIWFEAITKEIVLKLIIDEILDIVCANQVDITRQTNLSAQSTIIDAHPSGSANVDANLFNTYNEIIQANPGPVDESKWEKAEDVLERINARLESIFEVDDESIETLKEMLEEQNIKNITVNGMKPAHKVFKQVLGMLSTVRKRNESFLEQTFIISCDIADTLLAEGFYLISKFNRMCPVYVFENPHIISNPYYMCKRMNKVFPVIHRPYIYFLSSESNVIKFRNNPLKYIDSDIIDSYREFPLRIGIIGSPKSGKSCLAAKLSKRYGLMCISRGQAIRHVLENMTWSELAIEMLKKLELGECIDSKLIMNAVQTVTIDNRVVTNGFVFDGFPDHSAEATELLKLGLYPLIMIDINSNSNTVINNSQNEVYYSMIKLKPPYSAPFIKYRNDQWLKNCSGIKNWINGDIQNLYEVNGNASKWQCLHDATKRIEDIISKVKYYLLNADTKIVPVSAMSFSNETFEQRMSCYKNICPICLRKNVLRNSGYPADKKGLVQFGNHLYWFCPEHMELGLSNPNIYLTENENINIPEIPVAIKTVSPALLYENGICMVTYTENLPSQKVVRGDQNFAASYSGRYYLFCNDQCLRKFLAKPDRYYDITVFKESSIFPKISLKMLPNLGYLEQTLGNILTQVCCYINVLRPKYPGLNKEVSGLLLVALYLKIHNPQITNPALSMYEKAFRVYEARCKLIHDIGLRLRSMDNPFVKYPSHCTPRKTVPDSGTTVKSSSFISMPKTCSDSEYTLL